MPRRDVLGLRLVAQGLAPARSTDPVDVVRALVAIQAQDHLGAKWAIGLRAPELVDADVVRAFDSGRLLRTHVLRPTWHLVAREDLRWLLALTAPRVQAGNASYYRRCKLDAKVFARSHAALREALDGGAQLTRAELADVLRRARIDVSDPLSVNLVVMHAELDAMLCSGAMRGKQHTYALFDKCVPPSAPLSRDRALAQLAGRYFTSRGPATVADFAWWSGLTRGDARRALDLCGGALVRETIDGKAFAFAPRPRTRVAAATIHLLPNYDELLVAYADRSASFGDVPRDRLDARGSVLFNHTVTANGRVIGIWRRDIERKRLGIEVTPFVPLSRAVKDRIERAAQCYADFLGRPLSLRIAG